MNIISRRITFIFDWWWSAAYIDIADVLLLLVIADVLSDDIWVIACMSEWFYHNK